MTTEAQKAAKARYDAKTAKYYSLKLNTSTDAEIIQRLEAMKNGEGIQGYLKRLIREDMKTKEDKTMKRYIIKPEFIDLYGSEANSMTTLNEDDIERLAADWEKDPDELKDQLIELTDTGWTAIHRFAGSPDWETLNELIRMDSGIQEPYCETEQDYQQAVRDGFITFDGYYTTIWADE